VLAIAKTHEVHPDSVRLVADHLYKRWVRRDPYTTVTSHAMTDPSKALDQNSVVCLTVVHTGRAEYNPLVHRSNMSVNSEYRCSDASNFIYEPTPQPVKSEDRIVVVSHTAKYSAASLAKLSVAITSLLRLNAQWYHSLCEALVGRMTARLVLHLCVMIVNAYQRGSPKVVIHFLRENKLKAVTTAPVFAINGGEISALLDQFAVMPRKPPASCKQCNIRQAATRCEFCCALLYCSPLCREAGWTSTHKAECKVYARKLIAGPPGGASVLGKSKKKKKTTATQQSKENNDKEEEE
jgi:hypothetical protein